MRSVLAIAWVLTLASSVASAQTIISEQGGARTVVRVAPFSSVEVHDGAKVIVRYGPAQRVAFLRGSPDFTRLMVAAGGRLVIEKCARKCPRGYVAQIEIVTPSIASISVSDGGTIQSLGTFPRQRGIGVAVSQGGTIDIRSIPVESVTASVHQGGRILTIPQRALVASISNGGNITYWSGPQMQLTSSVQHGGMVTQGAAADANKPLSEVGPSAHPAPHVPALPPIRSLQTL